MAIRKVRNGWLVDFQCASLGAKRIRRRRSTKQEAQDLEAYLRRQAHQGQVGIVPRHSFGELINRYLVEVSPQKSGHLRELELIRRIRTPYLSRGKFRWLEDQTLTQIPAELHAFIADRRAIERRRVVNLRRYERRAGVWYEQGEALPGGRIPQRLPVVSPQFAGELEARPGRGALSSGTLRAWQKMTAQLLRQAWRWGYTGEDLSRRIEYERNAAKRVVQFDEQTLRALVIAAGEGFDLAILGACWIGWRKTNLLRLTWDRVKFPEQDRPGYIWEVAEHMKGRRESVMPMSDRVEALFAELARRRCGAYVFHDGQGRPFATIRKRWATAKRRAGVDPGLRWHDLRHVWVSDLNGHGVADSVLCELAGWSAKSMIRVYSDLRLKDLHHAVNAYKRGS